MKLGEHFTVVQKWMSGVKITLEFFKINNQAPNNDIHFKYFIAIFQKITKKGRKVKKE